MTATPRISVILNRRAGYWKRHPGELSRVESGPARSVRVFATDSLDALGALFSTGVLPSEPGEPAVDVVAGGDGTVCHYLSWRRAYGRNAPVLLIPTGTMNVVANDLGIRRADGWATFAAIQRGEPWHSQPRASIDVRVDEKVYSGLSFETGFASHVLNEFYARRNLKRYAIVVALKTVGRLVAMRVPFQDVREGGTPLVVQSYMASGVGRMVLGLRPFGRSPALPTTARVHLTGWQQSLSWWRLVTGHVAPLLRRGALVLRTLHDEETVTIETREPANLDGEMLSPGGEPVRILIRKGSTVDFIRSAR